MGDVSKMDYEKVIKALEDENNRGNVTEWQRSANLHRIQWIRMMNIPKTPETPYVRIDAVRERLKDNDYTCAPNSIWHRWNLTNLKTNCIDS
ncbi:hypothetical protein ACIQXU_20750 [Peribacillus sp. NPDC097284]|uniref:hypothetical protein n=1 Tax=Peribacillus sp. NPDC097284 TaxID=3364401 RepID=UPI0038043D87